MLLHSVVQPPGMWERGDLAQQLVELAPAPAYALGGVTGENLLECVQAGAVGAAAIRALLESQGDDLVRWARRCEQQGGWPG